MKQKYVGGDSHCDCNARQAVEDLCIHKLGQGLYCRLEAECQRHIERSIRDLTGQTPDPVLFLELVHMCWNKHSSQMSLIRSIFLYLVGS